MRLAQMTRWPRGHGDGTSASPPSRASVRAHVGPSRAGHDHGAASPQSLTWVRLISLQRLAGNEAVSRLVQRDTTPAPGLGQALAPGQVLAAVGDLAQRVAATAIDRLASARIAWIDDLPTTIRFSIDGVGDGPLSRRIRAIDRSLEHQRAAIDAARTPRERQAAEATMASSPETKAKQDIEKVHGKQWAKGRLALMDYLGCSLGDDAGVERYYRSLVKFGPQELWVHPEVARRLTRVQDELAKEHIPMPETSVGFGLRGRHVHPRKEDFQPGMMTHSLGVAVDWEAYKNVHIRDEQLMALIGSVTGRSHHLELPRGSLRTIAALGERSMGNTLTAAQAKDAEQGDALIDTVGKEFDRLEADSDTFRDSLSFEKDDLMRLHREVRAVQAPLEAAQDRLERSGTRSRPAIQVEVAKLQAVVDAKMTELRPRLTELFQPWLTALATAAAATRTEAEPLLKGKSLDAVLTDVGLKSKEGAVAASAKPVAGDLRRLLRQSQTTSTRIQAVRTKVGAAQAYLVGSGTEQEKADWAERLVGLDARAAAALGRSAAVSTQASVLQGAAPMVPKASSPPRPRKPAWAREVVAWDADIAAREAEMTTAEASLQATTGKLSPDALTAAYALRDERAASDAIRDQVSKQEFGRLQDMKAKLWHLERASHRLLEDASFMFPRARAFNPGVAQLTGVLGENESGKTSDIGGGGFFGTATSAKAAAAAVAATGKGTVPARAGFGKRFFQAMVRFGFEPAASWRTADSMHFQLRGLVDQIVPAKACEEPPADAEDTAKDDKARAAIVDARAKAAAARAAGESFSAGAERARATWAAERPSR